MARTAKNRKDTQKTQVQSTRSQSLPRLWPRSRVHPEVPDVQNLFPRPRAQGRNPRRRQVQLVKGIYRETCRPGSNSAIFLTRIRNAAAAQKHQRVDVPVSKLQDRDRPHPQGKRATSRPSSWLTKTSRANCCASSLKYTPDRRSVITGLESVSLLPPARAVTSARWTSVLSSAVSESAFSPRRKA